MLDFLNSIWQALNLRKEPKLVAGAGAFEMELARKLLAYGEQTSGLNQYAIKKFAEAFEVIPRTLAENSGLDGTDVISKLYAAHQDDKGKNLGVNVEVRLIISSCC
jgi:T-complex protein 1 subunit theta